MKTKLTEAEFEAHQNKLDSEIHGSRPGTPERAAAKARAAKWDAAFSMPQGTVDQRNARYAVLAAVAAEQA